MTTAMHWMYSIITVVAIILCVTSSCGGHEMPHSHISWEHALNTDLLEHLVPSVRPLVNRTGSVVVKFGLSLIQIDELDEVRQQLHIHAWYRMSWKDEQLTWDPKDFDGITSMRLPIEKMWSPDIALYNNVASTATVHQNTLALISNTGDVMWVPAVHLVASCPTDMSSYPYDTQTCNLKFGSWTYDESLLDLQPFDELKLDMEQYMVHNIWGVHSSEATRVATKYDCCPEKYPAINYTIKLKRHGSFHRNMFAAPAAIFALLVPVLFLLPANSATPRMVLASTIMLGTAILSGAFVITSPVTHNSAPLLGRYFLYNLVMAAMGCLASCAVVNIWERSTGRHSMPGFVRKTLLKGLGCILCTTQENYKPLYTPQSMRQMEGDMDGSSFTTDDVNNVLPPMEPARLTMMAEWRQLTAVLDRLLFIIFLALTIIRMFVLM